MRLGWRNTTELKWFLIGFSCGSLAVAVATFLFLFFFTNLIHDWHVYL